MNDLKTLDQKELEREFANDFGSPYFPILSEIYLRDKDYVRAEKVCKIGLKYDPDNLNGYYILSKIYLYNCEQKKLFNKKLQKKNKIIHNLSKTNFNLKEQINTLLGYNKYYIARI